MVKLLKFSVVVNLLLACGAAFFAYKQFVEREIIKTRMLRLETAAQNVAKNLKIEEDKYRALVDNLKDSSRMDAPLGESEKHATARQQELEVTKEDLAQTKSDLAATKDKLSATETELANTKTELEATKTELASTKTDLAAARERIDSLGVEIADLKTQINTLNETVQKKEDEIAKIDSELNTTKKEFERTKRELLICRGKETPTGAMENQEANILVINKDWNFVVLDKGRDKEFLTGVEGLVRRGEKLIGKAKISQVDERISVADILLDTLEAGDYVQAGDIVWFPKP